MDDISMEEVTTAQCGAGNACRCSLLGSECRDFSKEFILPDYVPDIKKIVSVTVTPKTEKLDAEGDRIAWECRLDHCVMLLCEDGELRSVNLVGTCPGDLRVREAPPGAWLETKLENLSVRATDPRRLTGRCRVCVSAYGDVDVPVELAIEDADERSLSAIEKKTRPIEFGCVRKVTITDQRVSEDLEIPAGMPEAADIVECSVEPRILSAGISDGELRLEGESRVNLVYRDVGGDYRSYAVKLPIYAAQTADCDDADVWACANVEEISAALQPDGSGETRIVELDYSWGGEAYVSTCGSCEATVDLFSPIDDLEAEPVEVKLDAPMARFDEKLRVSGEVSSEDASLTRARAVCVCRARAQVSGSSVRDGTLRVTGEVQFDLVCETDDENERFTAGRALLPFELEKALPGVGDDPEILLRACCISPAAQIEGGRLLLSAEVVLTGAVRSAVTATAITGARITGPREDAGAPFTLYYTSPGDDLWSVAKRYRVPATLILEANSAREEEIPRKKVLIIPGTRTAPSFSRVI